MALKFTNVADFLYVKLLIQFQSDSLSTWHECSSRDVNMQDTPFGWVNMHVVIA